MATLQDIRARLQKQDFKKSGPSDKSIFPQWNIQEGQSATLRFLPDGNASNPYFWVERAMIKLPFNGVAGAAESKLTIVQVPCMEMWNETCPVLTEVRPWFKDKSLEEMGRKYWKKRTYIYQGFVRDNPLEKADELPENPIRKFVISPQIFALIKASLLDPELEDLPTDYESGLDFRVVKTSKGGYADYSTSNWSRKTSALTDAERAAIAQYGLNDLSIFLPKKPGAVELKVIKEMFEASVDGQAFDNDRWGQYFRPSGFAAAAADEATDALPAATDATPVAQAPVAAAEPAVVTPDVSVVSTPEPNAKAQDILAMIRNRQKA
jgi:hypothetical protein